jgi:hypothetical protein
VTTDNLARFARLSEQAKQREAQRKQEEQREWDKEDAARARRGEARRAQLEAEGPPNGCHECYVVRKSYPWTGEFWDWHHVEAINPVERIPDDWGGWEGPIEHCMHACHGPNGEPLRVIAYA